MFDRMVNQLSVAAATTSPSGGITTSAQAAAALMRFGGINAPNQDKSNEEPTSEEDGLLSIETAEKMLRWHAEAIGRCVELSLPNDVCVTWSSIFDIQIAEHDKCQEHICTASRLGGGHWQCLRRNGH